MTTFDLAAKVVTDKQRAFVVHAGRQRRNHAEFVRGDAAFLEVPSIDLTPDIVASKDALRQAVRRFYARQAYDEDPLSNRRPSPALSDYSSGAIEDGGQNSLFGSLNSLFGKARVGDILITPGFQQLDRYQRPVVHFGEITAPFTASDVLAGGTKSTHQVPFRKVKWLSTVERRAIPPALEVQISRPPAVREVPVHEYAEDILNLTYPNYIYGDGSASLIRAEGYQAAEFQTLNASSELIAIFVAGYAYSKDGTNSERIGDLTEFTRKYLAKSGIENIEVSFSSPGWWRIIGGTPTIAMFVALGIAAITSGLSVAALQGGIQLENSVSVTTEVEDDLQQSIDFFLKSLSPAQVNELKIEGEKAKERIGLKSPVRLKR